MSAKRITTAALAALALSGGAAGPAAACETLAQCAVEEAQSRVADAQRLAEQAVADAQQAVADAQRAVEEAPGTVDRTVAEVMRRVEEDVMPITREIATDGWSCLLEGRMSGSWPYRLATGPATCARLDRDGATDGGDATGARTGRFELRVDEGDICDVGAGKGRLTVTLGGDGERILEEDVDLTLARGHGLMSPKYSGTGIGVIALVTTHALGLDPQRVPECDSSTEFFVEAAYVHVRPTSLSPVIDRVEALIWP